MTTKKNVPVITSWLKPILARVNGKRFVVPQWIQIDDDVTYEDLLEHWVYVEQKTSPKPIKTPEFTTYTVPSSKGDKDYIVTVRGATFSCTCAGYGFRRKCSHIDQIKKQLNS